MTNMDDTVVLKQGDTTAYQGWRSFSKSMAVLLLGLAMCGPGCRGKLRKVEGLELEIDPVGCMPSWAPRQPVSPRK